MGSDMWLPISELEKSGAGYKEEILVKRLSGEICAVEWHDIGQYPTDFEGIGYTLFNIEDVSHFLRYKNLPQPA
jgi:hypothetical protein